MRVAFLGSPAVACPALDALLGAAHEVALVVTQPDRPAGRSGAPLATPVKALALARGIPVVAPRRVRTGELEHALREARPELLVVVAYGRILPLAVLDVGPRGAVNVHFSLLPELRGAAPVQWALARGFETTGVTTMRMVERLDAGDVLLQRETRIAPGEHAPSLAERLAALGAELLLATLAGLEARRIVPRPQDDRAATLAPLLTKADGEVDPRALDARAIEGRVRGFDPWPGVWLRHGAARLRIVDAEALSRSSSEAPGALAADDGGGVAMTCRGGSLLRLRRVQLEGRRAVEALEAVRGRQLAPGQRLEPLARD